MGECLFLNVNRVEPINKDLTQEQDSHQDCVVLEKDFLEFNHISDLSPNKDIVRKPITVPVTTLVATSVVKKTIHKRNQYERIWELAHKATLFAVDNDDYEIIQVLTKYINKLKNKREEIRTPVDDSMQIEDSVVINQLFVSITSNTNEQFVNQNREEEQVYEVNESFSAEFVNIQNLSKAIRRGRPPKCRYESSIEKEQSCSGNSTCGSYKCGTYGQVGHNAAFHKK
ncbi:hypothetical protein C2G38_2228868 [Gigaspora rosea]|uniref:Uncharacterized protein n=1 Tax=Gigaspora rosea TaxID=44941 RepID=A0A397TXC0_9GLOM|nr:hypothetical protein C2G38_2228868 [Gigaspora rosea]